jgi:hypothetical protein
VKEARVDSRPPTATTVPLSGAELPDEEHAADRDRFEPKF